MNSQIAPNPNDWDWVKNREKTSRDATRGSWPVSLNEKKYVGSPKTPLAMQAAVLSINGSDRVCNLAKQSTWTRVLLGKVSVLLQVVKGQQGAICTADLVMGERTDHISLWYISFCKPWRKHYVNIEPVNNWRFYLSEWGACACSRCGTEELFVM